MQSLSSEDEDVDAFLLSSGTSEDSLSSFTPMTPPASNDFDLALENDTSPPLDSFVEGPRYASLQEEEERSDLFPSVDKRVRHCMQSWYDPPCQPIPYAYQNSAS